MTNDFSGLSVLTIADHGDARERDVWPDVAVVLSNYEIFWRELIVLLTNRVVPVAVAAPELFGGRLDRRLQPRLAALPDAGVGEMKTCC